MSITLTHGIFTVRDSFHITFVNLVSNDACIRFPKIQFEEPILYLLQTAMGKVEVRR